MKSALALLGGIALGVATLYAAAHVLSPMLLRTIG